MYVYRGKQCTCKQLSQMSGIPVGTLRERIYRGMTAEEAVNAGEKIDAKHTFNPKYQFHGEMLTLREVAARCGVNVHMIRVLMLEGATIEDAAEIAVSSARRSKSAPMSKEEKARENAAEAICKKIAVSPEAFNFRCIEPMLKFEFESDILGYIIQFSADGKTARLSAYYRKDGLASALDRLYAIDKDTAREVQQHD